MKMILENFCCCKLETGGLILGIAATGVTLIQFLLGLFEYTNDMYNIKHHYFAFDYLDDAPEHILRLVYVAFSIFDILTAVFIIIGIVKRNRYFLIPWILNTILLLVMTCAELIVYIIPSFVVTFTICGIIYIWYCIVSLYLKFEKEANDSNGLPMTYIEEGGPTTTLPYSNFNNDK